MQKSAWIYIFILAWILQRVEVMYFVPKKHSWKYMSKTLTSPFFALYDVDLIFLYVEKSCIYTKKHARRSKIAYFSRFFLFSSTLVSRATENQNYQNVLNCLTIFWPKIRKSRSSMFPTLYSKNKSACKNLFRKSLKKCLQLYIYSDSLYLTIDNAPCCALCVSCTLTIEYRRKALRRRNCLQKGRRLQVLLFGVWCNTIKLHYAS